MNINKSKRGNLMMVVMYATIMIFVLMGLLSVSIVYSESIKDSSKDYASYQTYKSIAEIACYSFVNDFSSQALSVDTNTEWLSISSNARYTNALTKIISNMTKSPEHTTWDHQDINNIVLSAGIAGDDISKHISKLISSGKFEIAVNPISTELDWDNSENYNTKKDGHIAVSLTVNVILTAKGETLDEKFTVSGLFLDMINNDGFLTFKISPSQTGRELQIVR